MLTFNSMALVSTFACWERFRDWVKERAQHFAASAWSCTMERSLEAAEQDRVHLHCYFSWHARDSKGIDHNTTDAWVFEGIRPRVDKNTEQRGPHEWLRAVQHGHFYVAVMKRGTLYSDTNYPAWDSQWVPEAWWAVALWRQHKLDHAQYLALSVRLRDGHDKRRANCEIV